MGNTLAVTLFECSLHSDDPGVTGDNELSGGSPSYERVSPGFNAGSSSSTTYIANASTMTFNVPAGSTVKYLGYWDSSGNFMAKHLLPSTETFTGQGEYVVSDGNALSLTLEDQ